MKKVLSIFLAIIMAFSVSVTAFAATGTLNLNEKKTVTVNPDVTKTYTFKASEQGIYVLKAKLITDKSGVAIDIMHGDCYVYGTYLAANYETIDDGYGEEYIYNEYMNEDQLYFCAGKGYSFTVELYGVTELDDGTVSKKAKVELTVEKLDAKTAKLGKNTVSKYGNIFMFVPDKTGLYNFRSNAATVVDPYIEVIGVDGIIDCNHDNGFEDDANFDLTINLKKGKVYMINCETYSNDWMEMEPSKGYTFQIAFNKTIKAEQIGLDWYPDGTTIPMIKGDIDSFYVNVIPTGAVPTSKFTVTSSNEKVAAVVVDEEYNEVIIEAIKVGKTTITVCEANGATAEYTITVSPKIVRVMNNIFDRIEGFFMTIYYTIIGWFVPDYGMIEY